MLYPTTPEDGLAVQDKSTLCGCGAWPVPVKFSTVGEFDALLRKVRLALVAPLALGVKVTVKVADWPTAIVFGRVIPESTNSLLLLLPEVTVTDAPVAVRLPGSGRPTPTVTVPKLSVRGATVSWPCAVPVPVMPMLRVEFVASEITARFPLTAPVPVGANLAVNVTLWPALRVVGRVRPVIEKPVPVTFACEIVTAVPPELDGVCDWLAVLP